MHYHAEVVPGRAKCAILLKRKYMKTHTKVLITGLVFGLLFVLSGLRADLAACGLVLFAIGMVAWTYEQYDHHHLR